MALPPFRGKEGVRIANRRLTPPPRPEESRFRQYVAFSTHPSGEPGRHFRRDVLGSLADATAPDGSAVRVLCQVAGGSMAQFSIPPKAVFRAVAHRRERVKSSVLASAVGRLWVGSGLSGYGWFQG